MVSQRQWVPQWLICRKAKEGFFPYGKKESAITAKALSVMAVRSRPRFPAGAGLNHRFPRVQKKKVVRSLQCTQNFLVV